MDLTSYRESSKKVAEFLNKVPPVLLDSGTLVRVPAGQVVVRQEEPVKYAWFLLMGELLTFSETEDGKKSSFITLDAPSMLSDLELLADMPVYASNVMANTDCDMIRCDAAPVKRIRGQFRYHVLLKVFDHPDIAPLLALMSELTAISGERCRVYCEINPATMM